ncbi:hypothetical protein EG68_01380 [Paragonimus skrjabini miyazakii]|uniref:C2H2-type domain-containing protein n=1 Tax=Paragonimus skrjabini miyazakii TaxID=59628 RepID=A0A8S9Z8J3_9TREM|nr:hypothetical protein EG68_01380 [Paragonimus skrjabini miyazakii]
MFDGISRNSLRRCPLDLQKDSLLEAKDAYGTWYPAKVLDVKDDKVHVHFCNWSSRYDTWYPVNSDSLRALKRVTTQNSMNAKAPPQHEHLASQGRSPSSSSSNSTVQFELGNYVMAAWRNQYEYLAEVIAHRQRQGDKSEYRLRYVWDNVIEWTPVHRLRKATQLEIDGVLKYCREHGGPGAGWTPSDRNGKASSVKNGTSATECEPLIRIPGRSQSRRTNSNERDVNLGKSPRTVIQPSISTPSSTTEQKQSSSTTVSFEGIEQDDMVYDKNVLLFHEACRKRRELKRQAIEAKDHNLEKSAPTCAKPILNKLSPLTVDQTDKDNDVLHLPFGSDSKSMKLSEQVEIPLSTPTVTSTVQETLPTTVNTLTAHQSTDKCKSPLVSPVKPLVSAHVPTKISPKLGTSPKLETDSEPEVNTANIVPPKPHSDLSKRSSTPVVYPCPHCTRQLRHSKLLAAHIANYHKDVTPTGKATRGPGSHTKVVQPDGNLLTSSPSVFAAAPVGATVAKFNQKLSNPCEPTSLLACHPCDSRSAVLPNQPGLTQCQSCFCWVHQSCYHSAASDDSPTATPFYCDGCMLSTRAARSSRVDEAQTSWMLTGKLPWSGSEDMVNTEKLISDVSDVLNWSYQLRPLVRAGWHILNGTKLLSPSSDKPCRPSTISPVCTQPDLKVEYDPIVSGKSADHITDPQDHAEEQVNRLYMELCAGLIDSSSDPQSTRASFSHPLADESSNCLSNSEFPVTCWPLHEEITGTDLPTVDANISHQVLSGFLQDLGPNVISEFVDLNTDHPTVGGDEESSEVEEYFLPRQLSDKLDQFPTQSALPSLTSSASETPTKGLGSILSSPSGVASLLQATMSNASSTIEHQDTLPTSQVDDQPSNVVPASSTVTSLTNASVSVSNSPTNSPILDPPDSSLTNLAIEPTSSIASDLIGDPLLESITVTNPFPAQSSSTSASTELPTDRASCIQIYDNHDETDTSNVVTAVLPVANEMDWLTVNSVHAAGNGCYGLPFNSMSSMKTPVRPPMATASMVYDAFESGASLGLDAITDTLTPDDLSEAYTGLDQLDQYILGPLERTLFIMESQLNSVTRQLVLLEEAASVNSNLPKTHVPPPTPFDFDICVNDPDYNHPPCSDSSSPFGSSSSVSLSPSTVLRDELPVSVTNPNGEEHAHSFTNSSSTDQSFPTQVTRNARLYRSHSTKQAARQLYRFTMSRRSIARPRALCASRKKPSFVRRSSAAVRPQNERL